MRTALIKNYDVSYKHQIKYTVLEYEKSDEFISSKYEYPDFNVGI